MRDRIPFSHLLPLIDLALLVMLVLVPITLTALRLYEAAKGADQVHVRGGRFEATIPRSQIAPWSIRAATVPRAVAMKVINLPGMTFETLISLPTSWPSTWHPAALLPETWEALIYPFFALPFWWMVGGGLDVTFRRERMHWSLLLLGTLLFGFFLVFVLVVLFGFNADDRSDTGNIFWGILGWTIGFAILPIAWIAQWIRQRRSSAAPAATL